MEGAIQVATKALRLDMSDVYFLEYAEVFYLF
jgi:hypothetical protein